ncbi:MAG: hypothetical protein ACP5QR_01610, partial [Rhizomicrobium sp.]
SMPVIILVVARIVMNSDPFRPSRRHIRAHTISHPFLENYSKKLNECLLATNVDKPRVRHQHLGQSRSHWQ